MFPLYDENRPLKRPLVNYALITVNVAVFLYFYLQGWSKFREAIIEYGMIPLHLLQAG